MGPEGSPPENKSPQGKNKKGGRDRNLQKVRDQSGKSQKQHKEKTLFPEHGQKDQKHIKGRQEEAEYPFILYTVRISRENTQAVCSIDQLFQSGCGAEKLPEKIFAEKIQNQEQYSQGAKEKVRNLFFWRRAKRNVPKIAGIPHSPMVEIMEKPG